VGAVSHTTRMGIPPYIVENANLNR